MLIASGAAGSSLQRQDGTGGLATFSPAQSARPPAPELLFLSSFPYSGISLSPSGSDQLPKLSDSGVLGA